MEGTLKNDFWWLAAAVAVGILVSGLLLVSINFILKMFHFQPITAAPINPVI